MLAIGLMSGTSLDGLDIVLAEVKKVNNKFFIKSLYQDSKPYNKETIGKILDAMNDKIPNLALITSLNMELGHLFANRVIEFAKNHNFSLNDVAFIASHGHTLFHNIDKITKKVLGTFQIGCGATIANITGITTVSNFRAADIAVGGTGAPLVPFFDYEIFADRNKTIAVHNIGGIANLSLLKKGGTLHEVIGFDTGPGNMMINSAMKSLYNLEYDEDGKIASSGKVIKPLFDLLMQNEYFDETPPKTTGREMFGEWAVNNYLSIFRSENKADLVRTFTEFTAYTIFYAYQKFIIPKFSLDEIIFCGGGAYNKFLLKQISTYLYPVKISIINDYGYDSSFKECLAFILMGYQTIHNLPSNVMGVTGAKKEVILGQINKPYERKI